MQYTDSPNTTVYMFNRLKPGILEKDTNILSASNSIQVSWCDIPIIDQILNIGRSKNIVRLQYKTKRMEER